MMTIQRLEELTIKQEEQLNITRRMNSTNIF